MAFPFTRVSPLAQKFNQRKFTRLSTLDTGTRFIIAMSAMNAMRHGFWGKITQLSKKHEISRTFIYSLASELKEAAHFIFGEACTSFSRSSQREHSIEAILSYRMEAGSSLNGISTLMERFGNQCDSVGFVSQTLTRIGKLLPSTLSSANDTIQYVVFAPDEIFSKATPILITVDPCSSAILRIELAASRKGKVWEKHFKDIEGSGFKARYMCSDDGLGLIAGHQAALGGTFRQSDTFHAIAHRLGLYIVA